MIDLSSVHLLIINVVTELIATNVARLGTAPSVPSLRSRKTGTRELPLRAGSA